MQAGDVMFIYARQKYQSEVAWVAISQGRSLIIPSISVTLYGSGTLKIY